MPRFLGGLSPRFVVFAVRPKEKLPEWHCWHIGLTRWCTIRTTRPTVTYVTVAHDDDYRTLKYLFYIWLWSYLRKNLGVYTINVLKTILFVLNFTARFNYHLQSPFPCVLPQRPFGRWPAVLRNAAVLIGYAMSRCPVIGCSEKTSVCSKAKGCNRFSSSLTKPVILLLM